MVLPKREDSTVAVALVKSRAAHREHGRVRARETRSDLAASLAKVVFGDGRVVACRRRP